jgi:Zn-dependent protease
MRSGFQIGKLFGIKIRVDWSWLLIFLLVTWNLSTVFSDMHQEWNLSLRWGLSVVAALLFFASVLAHEMAHSLIARAQGVPVQSITLFLFGGVSNIQEEPESPGGEFWMALLGPITSLVIGGILIFVVVTATGLQMTSAANAMQMLEGLGPLSTMFIWLGSINITLGIFNLIPGFPLDGGRVLRSILWAAIGDLRRATRWASYVGQGIAWLMIFGGVSMVFGARIPFFGSGVGSGLWLVFIGWFLNNASSRGYRRVVIQDILQDVSVTSMMRENPPTVAAETTVSRLIDEHIMKSDDQSFPVLEGSELVGLVTLDDVRGVPRNARESTTVQEIMTPTEDLVTLTVTDDAGDAFMSLAQRDIRQLPVLDEQSKLQGLLRRRDIVKWLQLHSELNLSG